MFNFYDGMSLVTEGIYIFQQMNQLYSYHLYVLRDIFMS